MRKFVWADKPASVAFPIARAGYPIIWASAFVTAIFALLGYILPTLIFLVITVFVCAFFRDPDRLIPSEQGAVVSPADGKVISIGQVDGSPFDREKWTKVSIFMSVFNVHVNRIPHDGTITDIDYYPGRFFSANLDKASEKNERNAVMLETKEGVKICFVQIAGLIARRIICGLQSRDSVLRGQRFGMICFGSRLDVYLPVDFIVEVELGKMVRAGTTVLGHLKED
jgi:phosphatidylserine decarboxylase